MIENSARTKLSQQIDEIIGKKKMLDHPLYKEWSGGKLSLDSIREYAKQYYIFVYQFPTFISAIHSNTPTLEQRQLLLSNLMDEELGDKNHPALWLQFCKGLGLSGKEVRSALPLSETKGLTHTFREICQRRSYAEGIAALYAYESQIPAVSSEKIDTLRRLYGITSSENLEFFSVHEKADVEHSRISQEILDGLEAESGEKAKKAAEELRDALWSFLDGIYGNYVKSN